MAKLTSALDPKPTPTLAPVFTNMTTLLSLVGSFKTFLSLLESSNLLTVLHAEENNGEQGITIFETFYTILYSLVKKFLSNLRVDENKELLVPHFISMFYTLTISKTLTTMLT